MNVQGIGISFVPPNLARAVGGRQGEGFRFDSVAGARCQPMA